MTERPVDSRQIEAAHALVKAAFQTLAEAAARCGIEVIAFANDLPWKILRRQERLPI